MKMDVQWVAPDTLIPYPGNAKAHPPEQVEHIANSIKRFGWQQPIVVDKDNVVVIGHGRLMAAKELYLDSVPVVVADSLSEEEINALRLADNKTNESGWDFDKLEEELAALAIDGIDMTQFGFDDLEQAVSTATSEPQAKLADRFIVPPLTILDTRQGLWQDRKKAWRAKIGDKGEARAVTVLSESLQQYGKSDNFADASLLDPVLCECMLKWFAIDGCNAFDVFAGDTVFGYVASYLGHNFTGIELRQEQTDFNNNAVQGMSATYYCDDGRNVKKYLAPESQDFFFSCPPYFDLEVYSDLANDASNQKTYKAFYQIIDEAFTAAGECLKPNRFAVVVCGDVRNKKTGEYYRFPDGIKSTFQRNGFILYNELVLVDLVGTARLRVNKYMESRKIAKVHQNVLVFFKGDQREIKKAFPRIEVDYDSENMEQELVD